MNERVAYLMLNNQQVLPELQALKLECQPGAACETMRHN